MLPTWNASLEIPDPRPTYSLFGKHETVTKIPMGAPPIWGNWGELFAEYIPLLCFTRLVRSARQYIRWESYATYSLQIMQETAQTPQLPLLIFTGYLALCRLRIQYWTLAHFGGDFSPIGKSFREDQEATMIDLSTRPIVSGADLAGIGMESVPALARLVSNEWPILTYQWRGTVEHSETVARYIQSCQALFAFDDVIRATNLGDASVREYGAYHLEARSIQEYMVRRGDYLRQSADRVTFNGPVMSGRLENVHTTGALHVYRGPSPRGPRCRGFPYDPTETEYIPQKMR